MSDRYFPIKTNSACQLKWTWSTIRLYNGDTSSCHRVLGDIVNSSTFDSFHNTPKKLADRRLMLDGEWPRGGCEYCKNIEDAGGTSDRLIQTSIPNLVPLELDHNINAIQVTPRILEIYFDNTCNMSCIYCWNGFSSKIEQENIKFGPFEKHGVKIVNLGSRSEDFAKLTQAFWVWMKQHSQKLARLHVLGGEPFYQQQFDQCLDFFEQHPCPDLEFNVVSNLMINHTRFQKIIQRIKDLTSRRHVKRFDLTCSIDCFGAEQEYVRYGLDLDQWRENFEYLVKEKWIYLSINQTLSCLTIKTIPDLLAYINQLSVNRKINQFFSTTVMTHEFLHPNVLGAGYFDKDFEKILFLMPRQTKQQQQAREYMQGIQKQINTTVKNNLKISQLITFLDEIDRRRGLDWKKTFPWLIEEANHVV
jgi:organic radical activating enzyme